MRPIRIRTFSRMEDMIPYSVSFLGWPKWLLKLARHFQAWLNNAIPSDTIKITEHIIDLAKIKDAIFSVIDEFCKWHGKEPTYIVIGREQLQQLHVELEPWEASAFSWEYNKDHSIYGVTILLVPYIDGIFALPNIETMRRW